MTTSTDEMKEIVRPRDIHPIEFLVEDQLTVHDSCNAWYNEWRETRSLAARQGLIHGIFGGDDYGSRVSRPNRINVEWLAWIIFWLSRASEGLPDISRDPKIEALARTAWSTLVTNCFKPLSRPEFLIGGWSWRIGNDSISCPEIRHMIEWLFKGTTQEIAWDGLYDLFSHENTHHHLRSESHWVQECVTGFFKTLVVLWLAPRSQVGVTFCDDSPHIFLKDHWRELMQMLVVMDQTDLLIAVQQQTMSFSNPKTESKIALTSEQLDYLESLLLVNLEGQNLSISDRLKRDRARGTINVLRKLSS